MLAGSKTDTNRYLIRWTEKAGIQKHITWHTARRTCPSLLHELGAGIYTIQKICGHKKIETTAIHTKVADGKLRDVPRLPGILRGCGELVCQAWIKAARRSPPIRGPACCPGSFSPINSSYSYIIHFYKTFVKRKFTKKLNIFMFYYDRHFKVNRLYSDSGGHMPLTAGEKIKVILGRRGMTLAELAEKTGQSRPNMSNKMNRDNFSEKELKEMAAALDCIFETVFKMNDTGEEI